MSRIKSFSAPSKALLAGGYLVLDKKYDAYVTALSSRMHAVIELKEDGQDEATIRVRSRQFKDGEWSYKVGANNGEVVQIKGKNNPFLEAAITTVVNYAGGQKCATVDVEIFSDREYHEQGETVEKKSTGGKKSVLFHEKRIEEVAKTGLGSSAGLVTVVTTALLSIFTNKELELIQNVVHNCAQVAHSKAQKKIGSGFDVAAAVYGSIVYRRFDPQIMDDIFQMLGPSVSKVIESKWDTCIKPTGLPPGIRLLMGDIKGGSETPKLVSKVLAWKRANGKYGEALFDTINLANRRLIDSFRDLHQLHSENPKFYAECLRFLEGKDSFSLLNDTNYYVPLEKTPFLTLVEAVKSIRINLKKLTQLTGADIEPDSQTVLLDRCEKIEGCLGGVVPGAGGYDAICLLLLENHVENFVAKSSAYPEFTNLSWIKVKEENQGLVEENSSDYYDLY